MIIFLFVALAQGSSLRTCIHDGGILPPHRPTINVIVRPEHVRSSVLEGIDPPNAIERAVLRNHGESFLRKHHLLVDSQSPMEAHDLALLGQVLAHPRSGLRLGLNGAVGGGPFRPGPPESVWIKEIQNLLQTTTPSNRTEAMTGLLMKLNSGAFDETASLQARPLSDRFKGWIGKRLFVRSDFGDPIPVQLESIDATRGIATLSGEAINDIQLARPKLSLTELFERLGRREAEHPDFADLSKVPAESHWMQTVKSEFMKEHATIKQPVARTSESELEAQAHGILKTRDGQAVRHIFSGERTLSSTPLGFRSETVGDVTTISFFNFKHLREGTFENGIGFDDCNRFEGPTHLERVHGYAARKVVIPSQGTLHYTDHLLTATGAMLLPKKTLDHIQNTARFLEIKLRSTKALPMRLRLQAEIDRFSTIITDHLRNITLRLFKDIPKSETSESNSLPTPSR